MNERIIADATVWFNFARVEAVGELAEAFAGRLLIGRLTEEEELRTWPRGTSHAGEPFDLEPWIQRQWIERATMTAQELERFSATKAAMRLGNGETEAVVIAQSRGFVVATDDRRARKQVDALQPPVRLTGTIGLLREMVASERCTANRSQEWLTGMRALGARLPEEEFQ